MSRGRRKSEPEPSENDNAGFIERRVESVRIKCPCCEKQLRLYLVADEEKGVVYEPLPEDGSRKVYLLRDGK